MKTFFYRISILVLRLFSLLPLSLLYRVAGLISFSFNHLFPYRREVVDENLRNSFPEKSEKERELIRKKFYRYFARMLMESVKMFSMNLKKLEKHIHLKNPEYLEKIFSQGKSVIVYSAHYGNWEWVAGLRRYIPHESLAVYKPLNNQFFNKKMVRLRSGFGSRLISMRDIPRELLTLHKEKKPVLTLLIADQSPVWEEIQYWTMFMNQLTAVYLGPEKLARKFNMAAIYARMKATGKGNYEVEIIPMAEDASNTSEYEITEKYLGLLEEDIKRNPEFWLWSHRRWKLTRKREREEAQGKYRFEGQFKRKNAHA